MDWNKGTTISEEQRKKISASMKEYHRNNPKPKNNTHARREANRRARIKQAIPQWSDSFAVEEIYHISYLRTKLTGLRWNVDHIVPMQSELVCGLHCEQNMRVIPARENIAKKNRHWPDMP